MVSYENGVSCLEQRGREAREEQIRKNKYVNGYWVYEKDHVDNEYNLSNEYPLMQDELIIY